MDAVSGAWGGEFTELVGGGGGGAGGAVLVLASETIYAPGSIGVFAETVGGVLARAAGGGLSPPGPGSSGDAAVRAAAGARALVAAKRVYFGVGGGVDEFLGAWGRMDGVGREVWASEGEGAGVGRVVLEVRGR